MHYVQGDAAAGRIRSEPRRVGAELGMNRTDSDALDAMESGCFDKIAECREIAYAAIPLAPQRIDLRGKCKCAAARNKIVYGCAAGRRDSDYNVLLADEETMVAWFKDCRDRRTVGFRSGMAFKDAAIFQCENRSAWLYLEPNGLPRQGGDQRWKSFGLFAYRGQAFRDLLMAIGDVPKSLKDSVKRGFCNLVMRPLHVPPRRRNSRRAGKTR
jgi:hypothetical protein